LQSLVDFEKGWEEHAKKLRKYMLTMAKFKEWTLVSNKDGNEPQLQGDYWFN
jgi:hypothetical protein